MDKPKFKVGDIVKLYKQPNNLWRAKVTRVNSVISVSVEAIIDPNGKKFRKPREMGMQNSNNFELDTNAIFNADLKTILNKT